MEQVYGVWAVRSDASMFGHAEAWCKEDGRPLEFESLEAAQAYALELTVRQRPMSVTLSKRRSRSQTL